MRPLALLALALLALAAPIASAGSPLGDLDEPHSGTNVTWDVTVRPEEAGRPYTIIFRNAITETFRMVVYDPAGLVQYTKDASRGAEAMPDLVEGTHRFQIIGNGSFQVTPYVLDRGNLTDFDGTLTGRTDAFVLPGTRAYNVSITGDVDVEWWPLLSDPQQIETPATLTTEARGAYVITVRGEPGTPYAIDVERILTAATPQETPALQLAPLLAVVALLVLRRRP